MSNLKTNQKTEMNRFWLWLFWTLATALGWTLVIYSGLNLRHMNITSWQVISKTTWTLFLGVIALGLFVGVFQALILRYYAPIAKEWIIISAFSYAFGSALAFLLVMLWLGATWPEIFDGTGTTILSFPLDFVMLIGGGLAGLIQAYVVKYKYAFLFQSKRKILLWTLASALSWGLGFWAMAYGWTAKLPLYLQNGLSGLVIGAITGVVLIIQLREQPAH